MSFKENSCQQISIMDSFSGLTAREQKVLERSWAKVFADEIFPAIDEKRFSVLYSDKASHPNAPISVIIGASIIKELFDYSDDEIVENHYQSHGYHPLVCYDGVTGDLLKIKLCNGTDYSCTGVAEFLQPLLDEFLTGYPEIPLLLRGDSGFATPDLYKQCETNGTSYVIRLKENCTLRKLAADIENHLFELTKLTGRTHPFLL